MAYKPEYNEQAVNKGLKQAGVKPNSGEGRAIHALLKGWRGSKPKSKPKTSTARRTRRPRKKKDSSGLQNLKLVE